MTVTCTVTYTVTDACTACGACLLTCPAHALVAGLPLRVRPDRCTDCGECVEVCPADAVVRVPAPGPTSAPATIFASSHPSAAGRSPSGENRRGGDPRTAT